MQIRPTNQLSHTNAIDFSARQAAPSSASAHHLPVDQVELSLEAQLLTNVSDSIRFDRVAAIRSEIAQGVYESADKLGLAVDRLLDELV